MQTVQQKQSNLIVFFPLLFILMPRLEIPGGQFFTYPALFLMWQDGLNQFRDQGGILTWLFGLGPGAIEVLDNDYMYSFINYGLAFTVVNLVMYLVFLGYFLKCRDKLFMTLGVQYIVFSLIIGYQADTLSGWNYPLLIMFYAGIALTFRKKQFTNKQTVESGSIVNVKKKRKRYKVVW